VSSIEEVAERVWFSGSPARSRAAEKDKWLHGLLVEKREY
jgi:hypothetical protein